MALYLITCTAFLYQQFYNLDHKLDIIVVAISVNFMGHKALTKQDHFFKHFVYVHI